MRVRVLFFGILRESFGASERWVDLPDERPAVHELLAQLESAAGPDLAGLWPRLAIAVNQHYVRGEQLLKPGDEVALLPPVSGGGSAPTSIEGKVLLTHAPLSGVEPVAALKAGSDGAVVVFDGIVRNNTRGRQTSHLIYEAYDEMAVTQMLALLQGARERFAVRDAFLHHRLGQLAVGETSVLIGVASAHRGAAFDACRWIIDTLKTTVPIWKREFFIDGAVWADGEPFPDALVPGVRL